MYDVKVLVQTENTAANFKKYISPDFWERLLTAKWTISVQQLFNRAKISEVATVKTKGAFHLSELTGQAIPVVTLLMPVKKKIPARSVKS